MQDWYINKDEFNTSRTKQESRRAFAADRERTFMKANEDFSGGVKLGFCYLPLAFALAWIGIILTS